MLESVGNNIWLEGAEQGSGSQQEIMALQKAIIANDNVTDVANLQNGAALGKQSLEGTLVKLLWDMKHLVLWNKIQKIKAYAIVEEYSVQDGYGQGTDGFQDQLSISEEADPTLFRDYALVKFIRQVYRVGDIATMVNNITGPEMLAIEAAMRRALRITERSLWFGNSAVFPNSWDGIYAKLNTIGNVENIIDARGANISEEQIRTGAEIINVNYGNVSDLICSNSVKTSIDTLYGPANYRVEQTAHPVNLSIGHSINEFKTSFGNGPITPSIFLNIEGKGVAKTKNSVGVIIEGKTNVKAPDTPSIALAANTGVTGSLFASTGSGGAIAGAYRYRVSAVNDAGESAACAASIGTVVAGGSITITVTPAGTGEVATGYRIYREPTPNSGAGTERFLNEVAIATLTYDDLNTELPGTGIVFMMDLSASGENRSIAFKQLTPMYRQELARLDASKRGFVGLYGTPVFYGMNKIVAIKNVASAAIRSNTLDL